MKTNRITEIVNQTIDNGNDSVKCFAAVKTGIDHVGGVIAWSPDRLPPQPISLYHIFTDFASARIIALFLNGMEECKGEMYCGYTEKDSEFYYVFSDRKEKLEELSLANIEKEEFEFSDEDIASFLFRLDYPENGVCTVRCYSAIETGTKNLAVVAGWFPHVSPPCDVEIKNIFANDLLKARKRSVLINNIDTDKILYRGIRINNKCMYYGVSSSVKVLEENGFERIKSEGEYPNIMIAVLALCRVNNVIP